MTARRVVLVVSGVILAALLVLAVLALIATLRWKIEILWLVAAGCVVGVGRWLLLGQA